MLDFSTFRNGTRSIPDIVKDLTLADLRSLTNEMIDTILNIISDAVDEDVVFVPRDEQASSGDEVGWTLGHVITHATATSEDCAALAATMARGIPVQGRSRYETPWETIHSVAQLRQRLNESRRIRLAYLDAWPDEPHLEITHTPFPRAGELNAIHQFVLGLAHEEWHLEQIREIMRQTREARSR